LGGGSSQGGRLPGGKKKIPLPFGVRCFVARGGREKKGVARFRLKKKTTRQQNESSYRRGGKNAVFTGRGSFSWEEEKILSFLAARKGDDLRWGERWKRPDQGHKEKRGGLSRGKKKKNGKRGRPKSDGGEGSASSGNQGVLKGGLRSLMSEGAAGLQGGRDSSKRSRGGPKIIGGGE